MAFQLQVSNSLNELAKSLCETLQSNPPDVFQPTYIITQTDGMNNWLKLQMADRIGIAANCSFLKPNDLINKIYFLLGGTFAQSLSAENLNWLLFKLLSEENFTKNYPTIAAYYVNNDPDKDVKRMALAEKVADLFDQYQIYRPDMILKWNDEITSTTPIADWQQALWINAKKLMKESFPDKTTIGKEIETALNKTGNGEKLSKKIPVIYLFGISLITEYHLQIFQQLAKYIDINFFLLNPAPEVFWFDDKSEKQLAILKKFGKVEDTATSLGNPLLTGWGKIIQDTFSLLFKNDELINAYEELPGLPALQDNLLHKIQSAVFTNEIINEDDFFTGAEIEDGSVTINNCYSPAREVEALYNYLVYLIDKKLAKLSPRDIVVMVSDIDLYASYIKAIFNNAPYQIKYTIADESYASSDSISNALHAVLSLREDNFTAEEVVRLLDTSFIRNRFGLTNVASIRNVLDEANIRVGIEGDVTDDSIFIGWKYGLQRIMYGICMTGETEFIIDETAEGFFPLNIVEGNAAHEIIRFVHFVEGLIDSIKLRAALKTIADWVSYVEQILHGFICKAEETADEDYMLLLKQLENYNSITEIFTELVSYEVFMHSFLPTITGAAKNNSFAIGGVTFCSLIPMRSIPFKVVALLGLNFDKFPRKENTLGFNLMDKEKRKGDRNVKENDKHLFLETILSARDYLYISYIGQSIKDNSNIPPSTLVDEFVDYILSNSKEGKKLRDKIIIRQPLHGFSQQYLSNNANVYTYLQTNKPGIKMLQQKIENPEISFKEIRLEKLINFLKNPFKGYYNNVLGIYYNDDESILRDTELFNLDNLQQWSLKNTLLKTEPGEETNILKNKLLKTGLLPLKNMAAVEMENVEKIVLPVKTMFTDIINGAKEQNYLIEIIINNTQLKGNIKGIYDDKLVVVSWSKSETKYLLDAYINYLALCAGGVDKKLYFISFIKNKVYTAAPVNKEIALVKLSKLLELYIQGHEKILAFDCKFKIKPDEIDLLDEIKFNSILKGTFENYSFPCTDTYMNKEYANGFFKTDTVLEEYKEALSHLLAPLSELFPEYYL